MDTGLRHNENEVLLQTFCVHGHLDNALDLLFRMHAPPSTVTYSSLLKACSKRKTLIHAKHVYDHLESHARVDSFLGNQLVAALADCGGIQEACDLACTLPYRTSFSWTALISAYVGAGLADEALVLHQRMQDDGVPPNTYTFVCLFKACGITKELIRGIRLHAVAHIKGFTSNVFVGSTLVSMYAKCEALMDAEDTFLEISEHNIVSWSAMLSAYAEQGDAKKALQLYWQLKHEGLLENERTYVFALQACRAIAEKEDCPFMEGASSKLKSLEITQALHADAKKAGFASDVFVGSALVSTYGKCGAIVAAECVFMAMSQRTVVSWSAMLSAYAEHGQGEIALLLYKQALLEMVAPDQLMFVTAIQACSALAEHDQENFVRKISNKAIALEIGYALFIDASKEGFASELFVRNTLIRMFGKCDAVEEAEGTFTGLSQCNTVSFNALLSVFVEQNEEDKALRLFRHMQRRGAMIDSVTCICVLQACGALGNLEVSQQLHFRIVCAGFEVISSVAATLICAYGNCACMRDAHAFFTELPEPHMSSWNACISGSSGEGNFFASWSFFEQLKLTGLKPDNVVLTSMISSCSHAALIAEGVEQFNTMWDDYGVVANLTHYGAMLELLGRAGLFVKLEDVLKKMPMQADMIIWLCLLGACRMHGNLKLAEYAFDQAVSMQSGNATMYVVMSNLYGDALLGESLH